MKAKAKWKGLAALVVDGVTGASAAIERIQKETAKRPFGILEQIPGIALPARVVHIAHDANVSFVHGAIRLVTRAVGGAAEIALDAAEDPSEGPREDSAEHSSEDPREDRSAGEEPSREG